MAKKTKERRFRGKALNPKVTQRQLEVLHVIDVHIKNNGYPPSVRDIGEVMEISSPNGVIFHLRALEKHGLISRDPRISRAIRIL